jgi:hypothetical protein
MRQGYLDDKKGLVNEDGGKVEEGSAGTACLIFLSLVNLGMSSKKLCTFLGLDTDGAEVGSGKRTGMEAGDGSGSGTTGSGADSSGKGWGGSG